MSDCNPFVLVEQHPQSGKPLFHTRLGMLPELVLDEGRDVDQFDLNKILDAMHGTERGELPYRLYICSASVLVVDVGAEETLHPFAVSGHMDRAGKGFYASFGVKLIVSFVPVAMASRPSVSVVGRVRPLSSRAMAD